MYRIRFHGRGGQGMKTAARILGTALFAEGFEVQDAPRYGAERRGAPIFATVRASRSPIHERGDVRRPDLVVVADDSLVPVAAASVLDGIAAHTVTLLFSHEDAGTWRERLRLSGQVLVLPAGIQEVAELRFLGATCAGAAAQLLGVIPPETLEAAVEDEIAGRGQTAIRESNVRASAAYAAMAGYAGCVRESDPLAGVLPRPDWIDLPLDDASRSGPDIYGAATSVEVRTGLWRTQRPIVDLDTCHRCHWICESFCPDGAIHADPTGQPQIDYDHCKGCLVCVAVCPHHAIGAIAEARARDEETKA